MTDAILEEARQTYYFGSSQGSQRKDDTIAEAMRRGAPDEGRGPSMDSSKETGP